MAKFPSSLVLAAAAALLAGACATTKPASPDQARLPTEQWTNRVSVQDAPRTILLAAHPGGLSPTQAKALSDFATRWSAENGGEMQVIHPRDPAAVKLGGQAAVHLRQAGVTRLRLEAVEAPPGSPVEIGFNSQQVQAPLCGQKIGNYTATASNGVDPNFGCAITANKAVMAASPQDLIRPRDITAGGAARAVEAVTRSLQPPEGAAGGASSSGGASGGSNP